MNRAAALLLLCTAAASAAERAGIEVVLERERGEWQAIDPRTVLDAGDHIRFRLNSGAAGWLYVYAAESGGKRGWLIPEGPKDTGYRVEAGAAYRIPASPASYTVSGPEGYDVLYWILSPRPLAAELLLPAKPDAPRTLRPRCPESLPAGDPCLDDHAGPSLAAKPISRPVQGLRARALQIDRRDAVTLIEPADRSLGLIVYEFHLAHRGPK
ncbi:MAG: DUF4384 domain-containing protein [Bryobacteraceae bacterium]